MKKTIILALMALAIVAVPANAQNRRNKKSQAQQQEQVQEPKNPFGPTFTMPCQVYDTKQEFAATSAYQGPRKQPHEVQKNALLGAQELIRVKMQHAYKGSIKDFSATSGDDYGNTISHKMVAEGERIIDLIIRETMASCVEWGPEDEKGNIECFVAIQISKEEVARRISQELSIQLTQEEKLYIKYSVKGHYDNMVTVFEAAIQH